MYYGEPYSEDCYVYDDVDKNGNHLILSEECDTLCGKIASEFENEIDYYKIYW